jgi:dCMP deaminase|tara:strand:+ start:143 stop:589 length:447 start_codon:yes stop_codon:yes gene_type:complete
MLAWVKNGRNRLSWPETAMNLAFDIAKYRSEDPYVQVGAVIIKNDGSMFLGYNGAPSGVSINWTDRDARRDRVLHAEANVLNFVKPNEVKLLACTHLPCKECIKLIAQKKVPKVYYDSILEGYPPDLTLKLAKEFDVNIIKLERKEDG